MTWIFDGRSLVKALGLMVLLVLGVGWAAAEEVKAKQGGFVLLGVGSDSTGEQGPDAEEQDLDETAILTGLAGHPRQMLRQQYPELCTSSAPPTLEKATWLLLVDVWKRQLADVGKDAIKGLALATGGEVAGPIGLLCKLVDSAGDGWHAGSDIRKKLQGEHVKVAFLQGSCADHNVLGVVTYNAVDHTVDAAFYTTEAGRSRLLRITYKADRYGVAENDPQIFTR